MNKKTNWLVILTSAMFLLVGCTAKQQSTEEDVVNRVAEIYQQVAATYTNDNDNPDSRRLDSLYCSSDWNRLTHVIDSIDRNLGEMGFFDADYWVMGQDYGDISADNIRVENMDADSASVMLQLHNMGNLIPIRLKMVNEQGNWMIDDFLDVNNNVDWKASMLEYIAYDEADIKTDSIGLDKNDGIVEVKLSIDYPVKGSPLMLSALRHFIAKTIGADSTQVDNKDSLLATAYRLGYETMSESRKEMMYDANDQIPTYFISYDIKKGTESLDFVSYLVNYADYQGGAHGSAYATGSTFTKKDGKCWEWNMIKGKESNGFRQLMKEGVRDYFSQFEKGKITDTRLKDMLLIEEDVNHLPLPAWAPYLSANGLVFAYQQYEIAPYAAGIISFVVPYEKIKPYLVDEILSVIP